MPYTRIIYHRYCRNHDKIVYALFDRLLAAAAAEIACAEVYHHQVGNVAVVHVLCVGVTIVKNAIQKAKCQVLFAQSMVIIMRA